MSSIAGFVSLSQQKACATSPDCSRWVAQGVDQPAKADNHRSLTAAPTMPKSPGPSRSPTQVREYRQDCPIACRSVAPTSPRQPRGRVHGSMFLSADQGEPELDEPEGSPIVDTGFWPNELR